MLPQHPKTSSRPRCASASATRHGCTCSPWTPIQKIIDAYPYPRSADRHAYVVFILKPEVRDELLAVDLDPKVETGEGGRRRRLLDGAEGVDARQRDGQGAERVKHKPWLTTRNLNTLEKLTR